MCRSIRTLREPYAPEVTEDDVRAAALQYVRKISGFRAPSARNAAAFAAAVDAVAAATTTLLEQLVVAGGAPAGGDATAGGTAASAAGGGGAPAPVQAAVRAGRTESGAQRER